LQPEDVIVSPPSTVCVTALPCKILLWVANFLKYAKNYEHWLAVDKVIAKKITRLTFLAHPVVDDKSVGREGLPVTP